MPFNSKVLFPFLLIAIVIYFSIFTVNQWQQAFVFKFPSYRPFEIVQIVFF